MKKINFLLIILITSVLVTACGSENDTSGQDEVDVLIDVNQFSRIPPEALVEIMGEPESKEEYPYSIPKTGESIVGELYTYEKGKYEFILFDDLVVRMRVNSPKYYDVNGKGISFNSEESIFLMLDIPITERVKKIVDNNSALRYSPVSDKVAELWIQGIEENTFTSAYITFNLNYF